MRPPKRDSRTLYRRLEGRLGPQSGSPGGHPRTQRTERPITFILRWHSLAPRLSPKSQTGEPNRPAGLHSCWFGVPSVPPGEEGALHEVAFKTWVAATAKRAAIGTTREARKLIGSSFRLVLHGPVRRLIRLPLQREDGPACVRAAGTPRWPPRKPATGTPSRTW